MKDKIKKYNDWLILILVTFVLMYIIIELSQALSSSSYQIANYLSPIPSTILLGVVTIDAINLFSGNPAVSGFWDYVPALSGILFWSILIPFLFVKGYLLSEQNEDDKKSLLWYPATAFALVASVFTFAGFITSVIIFNRTYESANISRQTDDLRYELSMISMKATELMILPNELGGGGGSFLGFKNENGETRAIQLSDFAEGDLEFEYEIKDAVTDSMITVIGKFYTGEEYDDGTRKEVKIQNQLKPRSEQHMTMTDLRN